MEFVCGRVENILETEENASFQHCHFFPQCFYKISVKGLLPLSKTSPGLSFENTVGKGENARNEQFLFFPLCFLPVYKLSAIFMKFKIVLCKHFQFGSPKFVCLEKG